MRALEAQALAGSGAYSSVWEAVDQQGERLAVKVSFIGQQADSKLLLSGRPA